MNLDFSEAQFQALYQQTGQIIQQWYRDHLRGNKIYSNHSPSEIRAIYEEPMPEEGTDPGQLLEQLQSSLIDTANFNPSPNYYGYITGGGNQISILAEILKNALNQNNLKWHSAPGNSEMERIIIRWICRFIGYPETATGVLASGGSVANFLNLAVMRKVKADPRMSEEGLYGQRPITVYVSEQGHSSIDKGMDMLGLGKKYLRKIPVNEAFQVDTTRLRRQLELDIAAGLQPACIIGIAGTTNTGSVDPLEELGHIAREYNCWFMVDGAYGLPAAGVPETAHLFKGLELADSILLNPHKWFFVPFEAACVIVKEKKHLRDTFSLIPDYLKGGIGLDEREDLMDYNLQLTKDFKALKIYMTFKTYGAETLRRAICNDIELAQYAQQLIEESPDFELLASTPLSIVCFRYRGPSGLDMDESSLDRRNDQLLQAIEADGRIFFAGTKIHGRTSLRINLTNHRRTREDIDYLLGVLRELGEKNQT